MSFLMRLNDPSFALVLGAALLVVLHATPTAGEPLFVHRVANLLAYVVNCASFSVPERIESQEQDDTQSGNTADESQEFLRPHLSRSLMSPAVWAFSILDPIYLGEAVLVVSLIYLPASSIILLTLPSITAPFVAANLYHFLYGVCLRSPYVSTGPMWQKYVSVALLGGTAYSMSLVHAVTSAGPFCWFFLALTRHFGWTTVALFVHLNETFASSNTSTDTMVVGLGHASSFFVTAFGLSVTLLRSSPTYGLTLAWALAACADGMRLQRNREFVSAEIKRGMKRQQLICCTGACICGSVAVGLFFFSFLKYH